MKHSRRFYRYYGSDTNVFNVRIDTSDLYIKGDITLYEKAYEALKDARAGIEKHISLHEEFLHSLDPLPPVDDSPVIVYRMYLASIAAGVGPMAAVAGAVSEYVGRALMPHTDEVIVENGGDVWMKLVKPALIGLYTDNIHFGGRVAVRINPEKTPCSVCTSTSKLGHSISFGHADTATVIASDGALADAAATALCNRVKREEDMIHALDSVLGIDGVKGAIVILGDKIAAQGEVELAHPG